MRRCRLRISPYNQGSIRHLFIVAYRPLSFHREVRGDMFAGQLILLPNLGVKVTPKKLDTYLPQEFISLLLLMLRVTTNYRLEIIVYKMFGLMVVRICIRCL